MEEIITVPKDLLNNLGLGELGTAKPVGETHVKAMRGSIKVRTDWIEEVVESDEWD